MSKIDILQFVDLLEWEFFSRLKDETAPADKEFSYVDLLNILDIVYRQVGISAKDREAYEKTKPDRSEEILACLPKEFRQIYENALKEVSDNSKKGNNPSPKIEN